MYTKSFRGYTEQRENEIPVETFGDSFSAKAFLNNEKMREENASFTESVPASYEPSVEQSAEDEKNDTVTAINISRESKHKKTFGFEIDDLLLIGLLLLFLGDAEKKEDMLIPILLGIILIFS